MLVSVFHFVQHVFKIAIVDIGPVRKCLKGQQGVHFTEFDRVLVVDADDVGSFANNCVADKDLALGPPIAAGELHFDVVVIGVEARDRTYGPCVLALNTTELL